jgi:hypothetical protein
MAPRLARLLLLASVPLLASCLSSKPIVEPGTTPAPSGALGSFEVTSRELGSATFKPTSCTSGDRQFFLGADFHDPSSNLVLRLVVDPLQGPAVRLTAADAPFDRSVVFYRADCSVFEFSVQSTAFEINEVQDYRVTLHLECQGSHDSLSGNASSTHCH